MIESSNRAAMPRAIATLVAVIASALVASGCGTSSEAPRVATLQGTPQAAAARQLERAGGAASQGDSKLTPEQAILRFTKCFRDNGVDVPDPDVDSAGNLRLDFGSSADIDPDDPAVKRAQEICRPLADAIIQSFSPDDIVALRDTLVEYAACLRRGGLDVPDPNFLSSEGPFPTLDPEDPAFIRANRKCERVLAGIAEVING
jgi:hypothetical protein